MKTDPKIRAILKKPLKCDLLSSEEGFRLSRYDGPSSNYFFLFEGRILGYTV